MSLWDPSTYTPGFLDSYQAQSWRDSYNGGRAAGDFTGTVNNRLDREREAFQGHTWSGSSTQLSALEYAQSRVGETTYGASTGPGPSSGGSGPGSASVNVGGAGGGAGSGSRLTLNLPGGPYKPGFSPGVLDWQSPLQFTNAPKIDGIKNMPLERTGIGGAQEAPGAISDIGWVNTGTGYIPVPSKDVKDRIEDNIFLETQWFMRNVGAPHLGISPYPKPDFLDPRYSHVDDAFGGSGEWRVGGPLINGRRTGGGF